MTSRDRRGARPGQGAADPPARRPPPKRGRPAGAFTQHRRFDALRSLLHQHPKGLTIYELAQRLGVTPRSLRRYLGELRRELDLEPSSSREGRAQRWRIPPAEVPRRVAVRRTQAYALLAARTLFLPLRGSTLFEEIDLAAQRLLGIARRPGRGPNAGVTDARLEDRFRYVPFSPKDYSAESEVLDDLFQGVADLRPLSCRCLDPEGLTFERIVLHPYAMILYKDAVYCVGKDVGRGVVRTLPVDALHDTACSSTERFELPGDFRVEDFDQGQFGIWRADELIDVVIDFEAPVAEHLLTRRVHRSMELKALPDGGVRVHLRLGQLADVATWVLGFGAMAKVRQPPELVERVRDELGRALGRYDAPPRAAARGRSAPRPVGPDEAIPAARQQPVTGAQAKPGRTRKRARR